ncbi:bile acid:sodium symporter family protein [Demequina sp. SYSU T00068]|uniref:bile acid:sodium symporter family protein n=1 Tax=Demequina lignilytica TaxID=3051663 RepID=UPI002619E30E|nr:bile acid:sodium symporter family protein [Demequina sp. SYSU T00068]MDN4489593.1 bile acid:sodium symporter family protein [Demequina sp. SYSU T00068]
MALRPRLRSAVSWIDPLVAMIIGVLILGLVLPADGGVADVLERITDGAIILLFFLYGARMSTSEVWAGLKNIRLQGSMLASTYLVFPLLGLAITFIPDAVLAPDLQTGLLYLSLLPSTVQSSVVFTSIARGNVAGAICGATVSNVLGIVLTPLLVGVLIVGTGQQGDGGGGVAGTLLMLLVPFVLGQIAERWIGPWIRAHKNLTKVTDRGTILLVAYGAVSEAQVSGTWDHITPVALVILFAVCAALLAVMLSLNWWAGARIGLDRPDRIALLMCGSKKSLATGLPMASVLFAPAVAASVALPVILFHQIQLFTCAVLARRLAAAEEEPARVG